MQSAIVSLLSEHLQVIYSQPSPLLSGNMPRRMPNHASTLQSMSLGAQCIKHTRIRFQLTGTCSQLQKSKPSAMLGAQPIQIGTPTCLPSHSKVICLILLQRIGGGSHRMLQQPLSLRKVCQISSSHVKTFLTCTMCTEHMEVDDEAISTHPSTHASTGKAPEGTVPPKMFQMF